MNPKEFIRRWIKGMKELTPEQQLKGKLIGNGGAIIGLILATTVMLVRGMWYLSVLLFFLIWLQVIAFIGTRQQYKATADIMREIENTNQDIESPKIDNELGNLGGKEDGIRL